MKEFLDESKNDTETPSRRWKNSWMSQRRRMRSKNLKHDSRDEKGILMTNLGTTTADG
jgi:hypothetical protein